MTQENVELIRDSYRRLEDEGWEALLELTHPEFQFTTPPELASEPGTYVGEGGIRRYFESFYEAMDEVHFIGEEFIDAGDAVIAPTRLKVKGRGSGIEVEQKVVIIWRLKDGLIIGNQAFGTLEEARAAVNDADRNLG